MEKQSETTIKQSLLIFLLIIAVTAVLYYGSGFLVPLAYGIMFAFLVNPVHDKLMSWGSGKYLSAVSSTLLILLFLVVLLAALGWQIQELSDQSDKIQKELVEVQKQAQQQIKNWFGITLNSQEEYADKAVEMLSGKIGGFLGSTANIFTSFLLSLIYAILLLAERQRIKKFFLRLFDDNEQAENTIEETAKVTQSYLVGKMIIISLLAVAYSVGFLIAGINYAILLGVLAAFLTFIPYAGNLIGGGLAALITLATGGSVTEVLVVVGVMSIAQVIESYILQPWIVGSNVNLNPLFTIIAVVGFSVVWGAAGAIIALPFAGILKVLFDHVTAFQPLGYLMGDD